jgi:hypothetical protein
MSDDYKIYVDATQPATPADPCIRRTRSTDYIRAQSRRDAQPQQKVSRIDHSPLISGCDLDLLAGWRDPPRQAS